MALRRFVPSALLALPVAVAGAGCAPIASFRPASGLMPDRSLEVGLGAAMVTARPYVTEDSASAGQAWVTGDASRTVSLTGITAFDNDAVAVGGALRINALRTDRVALGAEAELGYAWGAVSVPFALRVVDQTWVYTAPRFFTWSDDLSYGTPVGVSVRVIDGLCLRAEWQRSWQDFKYYNRREHYGLAVAQQF